MRGWSSDYKAELAGFKATTKIVDFIKACSDEEEIADSDQSIRHNMARYDKRYCRKLTIKLRARVTEKSLRYSDEFWRSNADHSFLPCLSVLLDDIQRGCIEVTWCVPTLLALQIRANIQDSTDFLRQLAIMRVVMDGEILYDEEGMEMVSQYSDKWTNIYPIRIRVYSKVTMTAYMCPYLLTSQKLLKACERGDVDEVVALLTYGLDVDATDPREV